MRLPVSFKGALCYFAIVFALAFALGTVRVLWIVPKIGARAAELAELPVLLGALVAAARWIIRQLAIPPVAAARLAMGGIALVLVLALDFTLVLQLRALTLREYFETIDPVSGTAYYATLGLFGVTPYFFGGRA